MPCHALDIAAVFREPRVILWSVACLLLVLLLCVLYRVRPISRLCHRADGEALGGLGQRGAAIIDFLMVMPFYIFLCLVLAQFTLMIHGTMVVHYAAYVAARSAITEPNDSSERPRAAAAIACLPISPAIGFPKTDQPGVLAMYGSGFRGSVETARRYGYAYRNTTVSVSAQELKKQVADDVTAQVTHKLALTVPLAGRLLSEGATGSPWARYYYAEVAATCTLVRFNEYQR